LRPKALYFVNRTAKDFGNAQSTVFGLAAQRKLWNLPQKQLKLTAFCPEIYEFTNRSNSN
jgi:hypothetical protein